MTVAHDPIEVSQNIATLLARYITANNLTTTAAAAAIQMDSRDLTKRLKPIDRANPGSAKDVHLWKVWQLLRAAGELGIPDEEIAEALFPKIARRLPSIPQLERRVRELQGENADLRVGHYTPQTATAELLRTGRWAVSALPLVHQTRDGSEVVLSINMSVAPLGRYANDLTVQDVRGRLAADVPNIYRRALVLSGDASGLPSAPGPRRAPSPVTLDLSVPVFTEDRDPAPFGERAHITQSRSGLLVIASSTTAGPRTVAAIIARALGWGLADSRAAARNIRARIDAWSGVNHRQWMRRESQRQLNALLFDDGEYRVVSHFGFADPESPHPLITAINSYEAGTRDDLPFIVLLREVDAVLSNASRRSLQDDPIRTPDDPRNIARHDALTANRDALWRAVTRLPAERYHVEDVRDVEAATGDPDWVHQSARRSGSIAGRVLRRLHGTAGPLRVVDEDAAKLLADAGVEVMG